MYFLCKKGMAILGYSLCLFLFLVVGGAAAGAVFLAYALAEKFAEELACEFPILFVDAIAHLGRLDLSLDESGFFKGGKMLAHCCFCDRKLLVDFAEVAVLLLCEECADSDTSRMAEGFGELGQQLLFYGVFFLVHQ